MLEPVAATILPALRLGRPFTAHLASSTAMTVFTRTTTANSNSTFPHDFFIPHPRHAKGKQRARPEDEEAAWSWMTLVNGAVSYHHVPARTSLVFFPSSLLPKHSAHAYMYALKAKPRPRPVVPRGPLICRPRPRRVSGQKLVGFSAKDHPPLSRTWLRKSDISQRRHASSLRAAAEVDGPLLRRSKPDDWKTMIEDVARRNSRFNLGNAWSAYESLYKLDGCESVAPNVLLMFANRICFAALGIPQDPKSPDVLRSWALRLEELLNEVDRRLSHTTDGLPQKYRWTSSSRGQFECLMLAVTALHGHLDEAIKGAIKIEERPFNERKHLVVDLFTVILMSMRHYQDPSAVLHFLVQEWTRFGVWLPTVCRDVSDDAMRASSTRFRETVLGIISCVEKPVTVMSDLPAGWTQLQRQRAGQLLIDAFCDSRLADDARRVLEKMQQMQLNAPLKTYLQVVRGLVKSNSFESANILFDSISRQSEHGPHTADYYATGLYLCAHQKRVERAEEFFDRLARSRWVDKGHIAMLLHAHAIVGDIERVTQLFDHFFPPASSKETQTLMPTRVHYNIVVFGYAQCNDMDGMNKWLEQMTEAGHAPDLYTYGIVLQSFAMRGEIESIVSLLDQMRAARIQPDRTCYTTAIALLAQRKDSRAAEEVYKRALKEGVVPDQQMVAALMHAYVEAASWQGVIRTFDYMRSSAGRGMRLTIQVFNTLLKAYVLIGAPFRIVANLFQRLETVDMRPDSYTFALLIQSACDSGFMDAAIDLYKEMEKLTEDWKSAAHLNTYVHTIIIDGFLRRGKRVQAKAIFDRMKEQGFSPSAVTYNAIIRAYGNVRTEESLQTAENFLTSLVSDSNSPDQLQQRRTWLQPVGGRRVSIDKVFAPLMIAYTWQDRPEEVERLYKQMLDAGGEPTLNTLTSLLDAHRRMRNLDAVKQVWKHLHELALHQTRRNVLLQENGEKVAPALRRLGTAMCIPLSMYIDALSAAGEHAEIAAVWQQMRNEGLLFDSHNWNHLAVALVRAGEPERAFEVVEKVILPWRRKSRQMSLLREPEPETPFEDKDDDDLPPPEEMELPPVPIESPMHSPRRRSVSVRKSTILMSKNLTESESEDFVHALHVLHQISPLWNSWRPHAATLTVLGEVLRHLRSGNLVQAVRPDEDMAFAQYAANAEEVQRRAELAGKMLGKLYDGYPATIRLIQDYEVIKNSRTQFRR